MSSPPSHASQASPAASNYVCVRVCWCVRQHQNTTCASECVCKLKLCPCVDLLARPLTLTRALLTCLPG